MSLIAELQRRNVLRVAAAYVVTAWLIVQVAETIFPLFGFGDAPTRYTVILLAIGFPVMLVLSWVFELTPEGLRRDSEVEQDAATVQRSGKRLDRAIMLLLVAGLAYFAFDKFVLDPARDAALVEETAQQARSESLVESYGDQSIAVLPFVDMSVNRDQEYMSDGIAEELLNLLAKIPELRVVSRSSAFAFKGKDIDIPTVAKQLNVAYVLEGSVRHADDQLRITAQLIEAGSDTHLWSETYDRKLENIFEIQDEISAQVVEELKITLLGQAPKSQVIDEQAYKLALHARFLWNRRAEGDEEEAFKLYQRALELAPEYAPAWAGIAVAYMVQGNRQQMPGEEATAKAREAVEKALDLDPNLADAHIRMSQVQARERNAAGQVASIRKALELEPDNPTALGVMANTYRNAGRIEQSIELLLRAEAIDPLGAIWPGNLAGAYIRALRFDEAEAAIRRAYELNGNRQSYGTTLGAIYGMQGRHQESLGAFEGLEDTINVLLGKAISLYALGRLEEAAEAEARMDALDDRSESYWFAMMHAARGDADSAFDSLNRLEGIARPWIEYEPGFRSLKPDPRWEATLERFPDPYAGLELD